MRAGDRLVSQARRKGGGRGGGAARPATEAMGANLLYRLRVIKFNPDFRQAGVGGGGRHTDQLEVSLSNPLVSSPGWPDLEMNASAPWAAEEPEEAQMVCC